MAAAQEQEKSKRNPSRLNERLSLSGRYFFSYG